MIDLWKEEKKEIVNVVEKVMFIADFVSDNIEVEVDEPDRVR